MFDFGWFQHAPKLMKFSEGPQTLASVGLQEKDLADCHFIEEMKDNLPANAPKVYRLTGDKRPWIPEGDTDEAIRDLINTATSMGMEVLVTVGDYNTWNLSDHKHDPAAMFRMVLAELLDSEEEDG